MTYSQQLHEDAKKLRERVEHVERRRETNRKYDASEKGAARRQRYEQTEKARARKQRYRIGKR